MLKLDDVKQGATGTDKITGARGTVTAKIERMSGVHSVALEGIDSTGRSFTQWVELDRLVLDGNS